MKQVIFNVGGALSTYTEFDDKKLLVDIGKSQEFNPITDFLLPVFKKRNNTRVKPNYTSESSFYQIDQLIISHPHNDHISSIADFKEHFYPDLLTCPNDNDGMEEGHKINWGLFDENPNIDILKEMLIGRQPPLRATSDQNEWIFYIPPTIVENSKDLNSESYCNNISIVVFLIVNTHRIFFGADIQKLGISELLDREHFLRNKLKGGVDILITPHHGLRSSFSTKLFEQIKGGKTNSLNIVSEKVSTDDAREVDTRYSTSEYCSGNNNLGTTDSPTYQVKTSRGHLLIDYSSQNEIQIEIINDNAELIEKFINV